MSFHALLGEDFQLSPELSQGNDLDTWVAYVAKLLECVLLLLCWPLLLSGNNFVTFPSIGNLGAIRDKKTVFSREKRYIISLKKRSLTQSRGACFTVLFYISFCRGLRPRR
jgi:hypothetical protein